MAKVELLQITENAEKHIELCTRTCYNSEKKITEDSYQTFLPSCIKRGHISILRHAMATFKISEISRAFSHEMVRHVFLSYLQRSQRYCDESNTFFIMFPETGDEYQQAYQKALETYKKLLKKDKREIARMVLPNACATAMVVSSNLNGFYDFLRLRLQHAAQAEIRTVAKMIYTILHNHCPYIFNQELLLYQPKLNLEFPEDNVK
jgi:thymidylate synthase (FAD)